ncbi:hypothetical protein M9Y10_010852 [Tritrichomonas musculus]|uniref:Protein kinase domain-containing protein n=1 Tax=Tritrichomonas musculus TaxID=1915356 RepID=A0ABR2ILW4_9EUKA
MFNPYPNLPHKVRNYVLKSVLGQGSFAVVYKAVSLFYNTEFAIKVLCHSKNAEQNSLTYEAEINSLKKLNHPNVIRLYDYFDEDDKLFIVLEYCNGGTLEDRITRNEEISFDEKIRICSQLVSALKYCYDKSVAHQDIKTANVLFDNNGRIKIADFGLSGIINHEDNINLHRGTLQYSAPEVCQALSFNPFKSDIWSLGVLFYRLFTYSYPFEGHTKDELKKAIINGYYCEKINYDIRKAIDKMLIVNPDDRISIYKLAQMKLFDIPVNNPKKPYISSIKIYQFNSMNAGIKRKSCMHLLSHKDQRLVFRHQSLMHLHKNPPRLLK